MPIFFLASGNIVYSVCPAIVDTPNELRLELRNIILEYLSEPGVSKYTVEEIQDLLFFYVTEKSKSSITNCKGFGKSSNKRIEVLLKKTIGEIECLPDDTQTCGQSEVLPCKLGIRTCEDSYLWSSCVGEIVPSDEICDNIDNNCNGKIDEELYQSTNELGACSINTKTCKSGNYIPNNEYTSVLEPSCDADNVDNDCDGSDAPACGLMTLTLNPSSVPADGSTTSILTASISNSQTNVDISFSSSGADDILSPITCTTGEDRSCFITIKSSILGTSTITATSPFLSDATVDLTFTNTKPTVEPITFAESDVIDSNNIGLIINKGSTITLQCTVDDIDVHDKLIKDKLKVHVWAGQCETDNCFDTRSWKKEQAGIIYFDEVLMDPPESGNIFTKTLIINQDVGTGLAATCQPTDSKGAGNAEGDEFGDAYSLLSVGCPDTPPTFSFKTISPDSASTGTVTITFSSSDELVSNPSVILKNIATNTLIGNGIFSSRNNLDYSYTFNLQKSQINGITEVAVDGQTSADACSKGSSLSTFNIDTQKPTISVSHIPSNPRGGDIVTISAIGNDVDKDDFQSNIKDIKIYVDDTLKLTCISSPCEYSSTYSGATHTYYSTIDDNSGNTNIEPATGTNSFTICTPSTEICDNKDNNCNSNIDEGDLCSAGELCLNGNCVTIESLEYNVAIKRIEPSGIVNGQPNFKYFYDLELKEMHGVDVNFNQVKKIYAVEDDIELRGENWISGKCGSTFLGSGSNCVMIDRWFQSTYSNEVFTETWIGTDSNGNPISQSYSISVNDFS